LASTGYDQQGCLLNGDVWQLEIIELDRAAGCQPFDAALKEWHLVRTAICIALALILANRQPPLHHILGDA
jgi:hypothetical protein